MKDRNIAASMGMRLLLLVVFLLAGSASEANPFMVDTTITYNETSLWQKSSDVAFDGTNFLVVWQDIRQDGYSRISGCRITPGGEILDKGGFTISLSDAYSMLPEVAYDGSNFTVAWYSAKAFTAHGTIRAARVNSAGELIDTSCIPIGNVYPGGKPVSLSIASSGSNSLISWAIPEHNQSNGGIFCALLSPEGTVLDSIAVQDTFYVPVSPDIAFDGANYLVVWQDCWLVVDTLRYWIKGARISETGTLIDSVPFSFVINDTAPIEIYFLGRKLFPSLAYGGSHYLLTWNSSTLFGGSEQNVYGMRITPDGVILDSNYIEISAAIGNQIKPTVAFDGSEFLATWMDFRWAPDGNIPTIFFTEIDTSGNVLNPYGSALTLATQLRNPSVSYGNGIHLVAFRDRRGKPFHYAYDDDIFAARIDDVGNPLDPNGISATYSTPNQKTPASAFDGEHHLIVWEDQRGEDSDIYGALVDSAGNTIAPPGIFPICTDSNAQVAPAVDFVEPYYLVAWIDFRNGLQDQGYFAARITKNGVVLDPNGIDLNINSFHSFGSISISTDSTNFAIACSKIPQSAPPQGIILRMDTSGTILDPNPILIDSCMYPSIAFDGVNWMISYYGMKSYYWAIYGIRLSTSGTIIPPGFEISPQHMVDAAPAIAFNGENYLIAWSNDTIGYWRSNTFASRCSPAGYDLDSVDILVCSNQYGQYEPRIASSDSNFVVVWTDERFDTTYHASTKQIYGTNIEPDGTVLDTTGIELTPPYCECVAPDIVKSNGGRFLLTYSRFMDHPYGSYRILAEFIEPPVGIAESRKDIRFVDMLERNYPNPFSHTTTICFQIRSQTFIQLSVFDASGRVVKRLVNEKRVPGIYLSTWDGRDENGKQVSNGIYFYRLTANDLSETRKTILLR
jgi:hypothetical protein